MLPGPLPSEWPGGLLARFRADGAALRISVVGQERPLSALGELAVRQLAQDALTAATARTPGAGLSLSLTWSARHLDVLVVSGVADGGSARRPARSLDECFRRTHERVLAADGALRVAAPQAGGFVVAATLPAGEEQRALPPVGSRSEPFGARIDR
ncbi:hypothetical protein GCM10023328_40990 [Modestobacter marinus]|uniref:Uncharacterized protein n=1 Tax=Modestobacter marinus TaxID=477641 RepID=A0A846LT43_9ACTN|nr:hypothetical protein [Modestobacter marinus]NIH68598.1 hypothetical protein [Modestobacter marinus]GGL58499.1 hypothetical protein GCM10011589_13200 [Modestobacter marinus]